MTQPDASSNASTARRLLAYVRPHRVEFIAGIACFFIAAAVEPAIPALLKQLLDEGFKPEPGFPLWSLPLVVIGLFGARGLLSFCGTYLFNSSTSRAVLDLRRDLLASVLRADSSLYNSLSPGAAAARVIHDPNTATTTIGRAIVVLLRDGTTLVAMLTYLFYLNWKLTVITFVIVPPLAIVVRVVQKRIARLGHAAYESQLRLVNIVDDVARAWRVVRTFGAAEFEQARFAQEAERFRRTSLKNQSSGATLTPLTQLIASIGVALILTLALVDAQRGGGTVGDFIAFITAMLMAISPMKHLTDVSQPIIAGLIGARACFDLIDTPPEPDTGTRELPPDAGREGLRFEQVTLHYAGSEQPALREVSLDFPAGQTIALVGPSGSGKTSVTNALLGFVAPSSGRITLDGLDISELRKAELRKQFAVVSQDIVLFDGSIADNVAYVQAKDEARIVQCLQAAQLWDFVQRSPQGLDTPVGSNGSRLSGGQRQRLAIARALYKGAKVWIFDEATSALDTESERLVQQAIEQWHGERTLILIAHRLSTVRNADRIHVMAEGRVQEAGTHAELLARGGLYASMVRAQSVE